MRTVINNGFLIDPANNISSKVNIAFEDGKITEVSENILTGDKMIDASGLYVTPGFIDSHMHEDLIENGEIKINIFEKMLRMGVTTAIGGNCGVGVENIAEYLNAVDRGIPVNYGTFLPHEILRKHIGVDDRYENLENRDIEKMYQYGKNLIRDNGLLGISFGIEYIPGIEFNELVTLAGLGKNRIVSAHLRNDGEDVFEALDEFLQVGKYVKTHLQISHIGSMAGYGQMKRFLAAVDESREKGLDIACDCYPYAAFSTHIGSAVFDDGYVEKHKVGYSSLEVVEGEYKGQRCTKELFEKLRREAPDTLVAGHMMVEDDIRAALKYPASVIISDGILGVDGNGHPRAAGSFPRFLAKYVRDEKLMPLEEGIRKITSQPAEILGISKGSLEIGADADITIFSLEELKDKADFENSGAAPEGIRYVIINGVIAIEDNQVLNCKAGKSIRKY